MTRNSIRANRTLTKHIVWLTAAILLGLALRKVPWQEVGVALSKLGPTQIGILILVNAAVVVTFSGRLWMILRSQAHALPLLTLVRYWLAGFALSYFTPASQLGGGSLQIYLLQKRNAIPLPTATASVVLSKVLERAGRAMFLLFGIISLLQLQLFQDLTDEFMIAIALGVLTVPVGYLAAARNGRRPLFSILRLMPAILARRKAYRRLLEIVGEAELQVGALIHDRPQVLAIGLSLSLLSWAIISLETWLALSFLGLAFTPREVLAVVAAAQIAFMTPIPAGLGAMEASLVAVFLALGNSSADAVSLALLMRARDFLIGGLGLWRGGLMAFFKA
ncbi:MAG: lysylphosphatidylglycerol synthase transmembrane domain-containing protein [Anaerolineales bacterium]